MPDSDYSDGSQSVGSWDSTFELGEETAHDTSSGDNIEEIKELSRKETISVRRWRLIVVSLLAITGGILSTFTYRLLSEENTDDYVDAYHLFATSIQDITTSRVRNINQATHDIAQTVTAFAISSGSEFPNVTVLNFEALASDVRRQSGLEHVSFSPIVIESDRESWEAFASENQEWIIESRKFTAETGGEWVHSTTDYNESDINPFIFDVDYNSTPMQKIHAVPVDGTLHPAWLSSPLPFPASVIPYNYFDNEISREGIQAMEQLKDVVFTQLFESVEQLTGMVVANKEDHERFHDQFVSSEVLNVTADHRPHCKVLSPVYDKTVSTGAKIVGTIHGLVGFDLYLSDLLPDGVYGIQAVLTNDCGSTNHTYELTGDRAVYLGAEDLHDIKFNNKKEVVTFSSYKDPEKASKTQGVCSYELRIYPTDKFVARYKTQTPVIFSSIVAVIFYIMTAAFFVYDRSVNRRNSKVEGAAARSNALVASLFPTNVRDQLYEQAEEEKKFASVSKTEARLNRFLTPTNREGEAGDNGAYGSKPIAELFPDTTVMFGDISGFTAWSSSREPSQVFMLLETLYHAFDEIAKKRRVFKVETIGDCYVAVTGLPDPRKDHAVVMCRFAKDCLSKMHSLTKQLEVTLGPDTSDLDLRVGLHSGPVTAGVLRGERSRFQLFGDTMNTAARMESNGIPGKIQMSEDTADLLAEAGKIEWTEAREGTIYAKGKGEMRTFWLKGSLSRRGTSLCSSMDQRTEDRAEEAGEAKVDEVEGERVSDERGKERVLSSGKISRLVDWNVDVLSRLLRQIVARRNATNQMSSLPPIPPISNSRKAKTSSTVLEEVKEIIELPRFDPNVASIQVDPETVMLSETVTKELREYVASVAAMYHENPFHNFEHASHVTMSVTKLLSRIVAPNAINPNKLGASKMHDHTYGITSDPLTQFACAFSALIHDVDHPGVPNSQLVKENSAMARFYKGKSVAEQNSVDLAYDLLSDSSFATFRSTLVASHEEDVRFRQLVVNSVMATDVIDTELKSLRNRKWEKAFKNESGSSLTESNEDSERDATNRKATIVIEHLIQASDVSHTMQHWHIYRKWNERLFFECYRAYKSGRADKNPVDGWYQGEIGFFDFYVIPLARKLKNCGVFGVSSDEYLTYAIRNRDEWERRGHEVVQEMKAEVGA